MTPTTSNAKKTRPPKTCARLLDAAAELFAAHGYANVTIRDISDKADANIAAVNYHFGSKEKLYIAVMDHARQRALTEDPYPAGPPSTGPMSAEQRLHRHVRAMFGRAFATGPAGWYMQIVLREMVDPTPALAYALDDNIGPHQRRLEGIVAELMRQDPDSEAVKDAAAAIVATAIFYHSCRPMIEHLRPGFSFDQATAERLTQMVTGMALNGIVGEAGGG